MSIAASKNATIPRRGLMLVISSPSGAGKSTISRTLMDIDKQIGMSVSVTTRQRRPSEIEGVHYHFISQREFERLKASDALLEWAEVHGNFYGTPREPVEVAMSEDVTCCSTSTGRVPSNCRRKWPPMSFRSSSCHRP